uniref:Uncharacterized protein n=1 Tax=Panagrolaimus sp. ES5 TaxID=591445 RepID=A0AC34GEJ0_9BILA
MKSPQSSTTASRISLFHATSSATSLSLTSPRSVYHAYSKMGHGMDIEKDCVAMEQGHK